MGGKSFPAINDVVATSARLGRMVELGWEIGGEKLGVQPCDGMICSTPTGSTAYNLSNGGPVLMWGLDAMAITFVAPHSLHARPLVVPRDLTLRIANQTRDVAVAVLADGHSVGELAYGESLEVGIGDEPSLLGAAPRGDLLRALQRGVLVALRSLRIENLVLIREADLDLAPGLNAVTGETGAGKTILAQAFGLLLGAGGDAGYLGPSAPEAYVEAELDLPDGILDDPDLGRDRRAAARGRDDPRRRAARLRRRPHPRLRVGPQRPARGAGDARRAPRRDVGAVRAAPACAVLRTSSTCSTPSPGRSSCAAAASSSGPGAS